MLLAESLEFIILQILNVIVVPTLDGLVHCCALN